MSRLYNAFKNILKGGAQKTTGTEAIDSVKVAKDLKKRFDTKQDIFKSIDEKAGSNVSNQKKSEIKLDASKKVSKIYDKYEKKAKGGRVGLKFGSKKSNIQKIKETFGPKNTKKLSPKQMKIAKLAGNPKKIDAADFAKLRRS